MKTVTRTLRLVGGSVWSVTRACMPMVTGPSPALHGPLSVLTAKKIRPSANASWMIGGIVSGGGPVGGPVVGGRVVGGRVVVRVEVAVLGEGDGDSDADGVSDGSADGDAVGDGDSD